ncbi:MAG: glycosyltransferase [Halomonas sp.]|nr:glycosyltransferase [Halomonas sp.]MBR2514705.1 glycosyltransferase [Halomonas sp.]
MMRILFVASRLHLNYTDSLRALANKFYLKVLVSWGVENERHNDLSINRFPEGLFSRALTPLHRSAGLKTEQIAYRKRHPSLVWLLRYIREHRIDTVYARRDNKHLLRTAWLAARLAGCRFVTYRQQILDSAKQMDSQAIYPLCKISDEVKSPVNFIPLAIDLSRIPTRPLLPYSSAGSEPLRIMAVGKLIERKGHQLLIEAAAQLRDRLPLQISIYGAYSEFHAHQYGQQLAEMIADYGLQNRVRLMPQIAPDAMLEEYARHHLFVYAGWVQLKRDGEEETYDRANGTTGTQLYSLIEAMATGLPIVCASERRVVGAVNNGSNGLVFEKGNADDLVNKIEVIANMDLAAMGARSRALVEIHYNAQDFTKRFCEFTKD